MLPPRGLWFFPVAIAALAAATILGPPQLMLVSLTLLLWFLAQWFLFQLRVRSSVPYLKVERFLSTPRGNVESIWARQPVEVVVSVRNAGRMDLPYVVVTDRLPELAQVTEG